MLWAASKLGPQVCYFSSLFHRGVVALTELLQGPSFDNTRTQEVSNTLYACAIVEHSLGVERLVSAVARLAQQPQHDRFLGRSNSQECANIMWALARLSTSADSAVQVSTRPACRSVAPHPHTHTHTLSHLHTHARTHAHTRTHTLYGMHARIVGGCRLSAWQAHHQCTVTY